MNNSLTGKGYQVSGAHRKITPEGLNVLVTVLQSKLAMTTMTFKDQQVLLPRYTKQGTGTRTFIVVRGKFKFFIDVNDKITVLDIDASVTNQPGTSFTTLSSAKVLAIPTDGQNPILSILDEEEVTVDDLMGNPVMREMLNTYCKSVKWVEDNVKYV